MRLGDVWSLDGWVGIWWCHICAVKCCTSFHAELTLLLRQIRQVEHDQGFHFTFTSTVKAHGEHSYLYKSLKLRGYICVALCLQNKLNIHYMKIETHHNLKNEELQRRIKAAVSARPCLCCHSKPGFQRLRNKIMLHLDGHVTKILLPYNHIMQK